MKAKIEIEIKKQKFKLEVEEARELFDSLKAIFEPSPQLTSTGKVWIYPSYPPYPEEAQITYTNSKDIVGVSTGN